MISVGYSALEHLCDAILLSHDVARTWLLMAESFTAYLDDSGHPDDKEYLVVAGLLTSQDQWQRLESEWRDALARRGLESLHMVDFETDHVGYRHLSAREKSLLCDNLACLIRVRVRMSYCFAVPMKAYREVNEEWALQECCGTPYALAGGNVVKELAAWRNRNKDKCDELIVTFEDGTKHKGDLIECLDRDKFSRSGYAFADKKKIVALQAADMFAWECYHSFETESVRPSFGELLRIPSEQGVFTRADLEDGCRERCVMKRSELPPDKDILFASALRRPRKRTIV